MDAEARGLTAAELRGLGHVGGFFVLPTEPPGPGPYAPLADAYAAPRSPSPAADRSPSPATGPQRTAPTAAPHVPAGPALAPSLAQRVARVADRLARPSTGSPRPSRSSGSPRGSGR